MSAFDCLDQAGSWFDGRVRLIPVPSHNDRRGELLPIDLELLPWVPRRVFTISNVPAGTCRGGHGHNSGRQLLFCVQGQIDVRLRYRGEEIELVLTPGSPGILIHEQVWAEQRYLLQHSVLLVFASEAYNPDSYFDIEAPGG